MTTRPILVSGLKSTGRPHLGNYFGALKNWISHQDSYDCRFFIADLHALTVQDPIIPHLGSVGFEVVLDFLALGLDPQKATIYRQSDVPEVTELMWYFSPLITVPYMMRAHAYKDIEAKGGEVSVKTFMYPVLMSADILMHNAVLVPVGKDQSQHLEIARDIAQKFNHHHGETFAIPKSYIDPKTAIVPGVDGRKMSKSYKNTIPLFSDEETIKKQIMSIVTDSKGVQDVKDTETCTIIALLRLVGTPEVVADVENRYRTGGIGYKEAKDTLYQEVIRFLSPMWERRKKLAENPEVVHAMLKEHAERVRKDTKPLLEDVRRKIWA